MRCRFMQVVLVPIVRYTQSNYRATSEFGPFPGFSLSFTPMFPPQSLLPLLLRHASLSTTRRVAATATRQVRHFTNPHGYDALVLGAYNNSDLHLTATQGISDSTRNQILEQLSTSNFTKKDDVRLLYNIGGIKQLAVVSLGDKPKSSMSQDVALETARRSVSGG